MQWSVVERYKRVKLCYFLTINYKISKKGSCYTYYKAIGTFINNDHANCIIWLELPLNRQIPIQKCESQNNSGLCWPFVNWHLLIFFTLCTLNNRLCDNNLITYIELSEKCIKENLISFNQHIQDGTFLQDILTWFWRKCIPTQFIFIVHSTKKDILSNLNVWKIRDSKWKPTISIAIIWLGGKVNPTLRLHFLSILCNALYHKIG